ncbi:MAG: hypothetical protein C4308_00745 [Chitinophagaceae bacterium]
MKKLLSISCLYFCLHSIGQPPAELTKATLKTSGEKQLIKALLSLVNREGNKKIVFRRMEVYSSEMPWL